MGLRFIQPERADPLVDWTPPQMNLPAFPDPGEKSDRLKGLVRPPTRVSLGVVWVRVGHWALDWPLDHANAIQINSSEAFDGWETPSYRSVGRAPLPFFA